MKSTTTATVIKNEERELLKAKLPAVTQLLEQAKQVQAEQDKLVESYTEFVSELNETETGLFELTVDEEDYVVTVRNGENVKGMTLMQLVAQLNGDLEKTQAKQLEEIKKELIEQGNTNTQDLIELVDGIVALVEVKGNRKLNHDHLVARYKGLTVKDYKAVQIVDIFGEITVVATDGFTEVTVTTGNEVDLKKMFEIK